METHQVGEGWGSRYSEVGEQWGEGVSHGTLRVGERGIRHILACGLFKE